MHSVIFYGVSTVGPILPTEANRELATIILLPYRAPCTEKHDSVYRIDGRLIIFSLEWQRRAMCDPSDGIAPGYPPPVFLELVPQRLKQRPAITKWLP